MGLRRPGGVRNYLILLKIETEIARKRSTMSKARARGVNKDFLGLNVNIMGFNWVSFSFRGY